MIFFNIILTIIFISFILGLKKKLKKNLERQIYNFRSKQIVDLLISVIVVGVFIMFFVVIFRILRVLNLEPRNFDLKYLLIVLGIESKYYLTLILNIIFCINFFLNLKNYIFSVVRLHFFRLYFKYFYEKKIATRIRGFFFRLEIRFIKILPKNIIFLGNIIFNFWFKIVFLCVVIYCILFNNFVIDLKYMPLYGLIYLIYSIHKFSIKMKSNFDIGLYIYYDNFLYITDKGKFKLDKYIDFLILGFSTYNFYDDFDIFKAIKSKEIKSNMLFFDLKEDSYVF